MGMMVIIGYRDTGRRRRWSVIYGRRDTGDMQVVFMAGMAGIGDHMSGSMAGLIMDLDMEV
jgi:hypothetical protein